MATAAAPDLADRLQDLSDRLDALDLADRLQNLSDRLDACTESHAALKTQAILLEKRADACLTELRILARESSAACSGCEEGMPLAATCAGNDPADI